MHSRDAAYPPGSKVAPLSFALSMDSSILPPELTDYIIDFAWDDPPTLRSCTLTCRAWRPRSKLHLRAFDMISLKSVADLAVWTKRVARPESRRFLTHIHSMFVWEDPERPFIHIIPLCISGMFVPRLQTITFTNLGRLESAITMNWHHSFFSLLASYKAVTELTIYGGRLHEMEDLRRIVEVLPSLKVVSISALNFVRPPRGAGLVQEQEHCRSWKRHSLDHLKFLGSVTDGHLELLRCLQFFSEARRITTEAESAMATFPAGNMTAARFPVSRLLLRAFVGWYVPVFLVQCDWGRATSGVQGGRDNRYENTPDALRRLQITADDTSLIHNIHVEKIEYNITIWEDCLDFRATKQAIITMLSQGVGEKVTEICLCLTFLCRNLEDFVSYATANEGRAACLPSLDDAAIQFGLQNVTAVQLVIRGATTTSTPVAEAAMRIIPVLFAHWGGRGMLSVSGPRWKFEFPPPASAPGADVTVPEQAGAAPCMDSDA
ncbi:uncharacterized protein C8Q71DRAFT_208310 [Rhodofomes roseus]|uniref:F-box domain-containing protein n=1 Tax=Rhodofomes roseus TaxID=34475 RepID=A0ABQ8KTZ8_9APHY|nr:uncharacterized protein C8Q71DRAFT_208310 [Rhodofomes roseus]KAH9842557.1 hypothetical protein C8Q71DRAFT_208310 [Rhodofomes roseus]